MYRKLGPGKNGERDNVIVKMTKTINTFQSFLVIAVNQTLQC